MKFSGDKQTYPTLTKLSRIGANLILIWCPIDLASRFVNLPVPMIFDDPTAHMAVPTIANFTLAGIALLLVSSKSTNLLWFVRTLLFVLLALSLYTLSGYASGMLQSNTQTPSQIGFIFGADLGRMAMATAFDFALFSIALLIGKTTRTGHIASLLNALGLTLASLALIGHTYDATALYKVLPFTAMSPPTSIAFIILFCASLLARPTLGWTARVIGPDSGGVAARRLLPAVIITPFLLGWLVLNIGFDPAFGFSLVAATTIVILGLITYLVSHWLARRDVDLTNEVILRRHTQAKLETQNDRLNLLNRITQAVAEHQDDASIFQVVIHTLEEQLPLDFATICLCDPTKTYLTVQHVGAKSFQLAQGMDIREHERIEIDGNGLGTCVNGFLVYEPDTSAISFPFPERLNTAGLHSLVLSPLMIGNDIYGMLIVARHAKKAFSSSDCEFLDQLCKHVALAAQQSQLRRNLQRAYDDMRDTQQSVMQHERLRALGQMASGITHDINNAIAPISIRTQSILETEQNLSEPVKSYLTMVNRQINDVAATIERLREFYREREEMSDLAPIDLNTLAEQVIELSEARWKDMARRDGITITVKTEFDGALPLIMGKDNELREVMVNLMFNAVDAMPDGGAITIRSKITDDTASAFDPDNPGGNKLVTLEITDTGVGMREDTIRRCMEPFYTTKGERGTGLGLAMVHGILKRHDASIDIKSTLGTGTTFALTFPIAKDHAEPGLAVATLLKPEPMRLLLIDDDPYVLDSLVLVLELDGHKITGTTDAKEGLELFKAALDSGDPFETVITDLGMPQLDGNQVSRSIKSMSAHTPVILLTGWGQRLGGGRDKEVEADFVMAKPPQLSKLREQLQLCQEKASAV